MDVKHILEKNQLLVDETSVQLFILFEKLRAFVLFLIQMY